MKMKMLLLCVLLTLGSLPAFASGTVTGTVTNFSSAPLSGVSVQLYNAVSGKAISKTGMTDATGNYSIGSVIAGSYKVLFFGSNTAKAPYVQKWNNGAGTFVDAIPITVTNRATTANINAMMGSVAHPALNLGSVANAIAGTVVKVPVTIVADGAAISSAALTITFDPTKIANVTVYDPTDTTQTKLLGPAATGKGVMEGIQAPGVYKVVLLSIGNSNVIGDGVVVNLFFEIAADAIYPIVLTSAPEAADPSGHKVEITGESGSITN